MNIMDVRLRQPSVADAERLGRMHYASWRDAYASFLPAEFWGEDTERRWISSWVAGLKSPQPGTTTLIALHDGEILGFEAHDATAPPASSSSASGISTP